MTAEEYYSWYFSRSLNDPISRKYRFNGRDLVDFAKKYARDKDKGPEWFFPELKDKD